MFLIFTQGDAITQIVLEMRGQGVPLPKIIEHVKLLK